MSSRLAAEEERLLACVHCGFCLTACPTYRVLGEENDSPRGRIYLMRALAEGRLEGVRDFATHIDRCLGCRACETACPAGVEYGALLEVARHDRRELAGEPGLPVRILLGIFSSERATRWFLRAGRWLRDAGLAGRLGRWLPGRAGLAFRLLAASGPTGDAEPPGAPGPGRAVPAARATEPRRGEDPRAGVGRPTSFTLLEGCVMSGLFDRVHGATRRTLRASGYRELAATGQGCCGALHAHAGMPREARRLARRNIRAFQDAGASAVAVNSAGCGAAMREYPKWFRGEPVWAARAGEVANAVRDVSELLSDPPIRPPCRLPGRAVYDAPCHLLHGQGIREEPLLALDAVADLRVAPLPSSDRCCGGAGVYNLSRPRLSDAVLAEKLAEIQRTECDWVLTGNPGCIMQIGAGLREIPSMVPVLHPVELLDRAFRNSGVYARTEPAGANPITR